jgi:hypothetical protein
MQHPWLLWLLMILLDQLFLYYHCILDLLVDPEYLEDLLLLEALVNPYIQLARSCCLQVQLVLEVLCILCTQLDLLRLIVLRLLRLLL